MEFVLTTRDANGELSTQPLTADSVLEAGEMSSELVPAGSVFVSVMVTVPSSPPPPVILTSPDGTPWQLSVTDDGTPNVIPIT